MLDVRNKTPSSLGNPVDSVSQRLILSLLTLLIMGLSCSTLIGSTAAKPCDEAAPRMANACNCCTGNVCDCEAESPQDQPKPLLPAPTSSHDTIVLIRAPDGGRDEQKPIAPEEHEQRLSWVIDAAASGQSVPLYCRHCSRLI